MNKDKLSVLQLMVDVYQNTNRLFCLQSGMSPEDTEKQLSDSLPTINYILGLVYDKLYENDIITE